MKNVVIILDPPHGANVSGKCSPDGTHKEYLWGRERIQAIKTILTSMGYEVYETTTSKDEPGLSKRKNFASSVKGDRKLLLSLHNNASGSGTSWRKPNGVSVYTCKGFTDSDICADIIFRRFEKDFPEIKMNQFSPKDKDFEENFTVLMGDYMAVLIEWLFQDNKEDVEKLKDPVFNKRFEDSLVTAIEEINKHFGE